MTLQQIIIFFFDHLKGSLSNSSTAFVNINNGNSSPPSRNSKLSQNENRNKYTSTVRFSKDSSPIDPKFPSFNRIFNILYFLYFLCFLFYFILFYFILFIYFILP